LNMSCTSRWLLLILIEKSAMLAGSNRGDEPNPRVGHLQGVHGHLPAVHLMFEPDPRPNPYAAVAKSRRQRKESADVLAMARERVEQSGSALEKAKQVIEEAKKKVGKR
jgi:hypothetical protein